MSCTKLLLHKYKTKYGNRYNYMVFNQNQSYEFHPEGLRKHEYDLRCGSRTYKYWVFKSGVFINKGDGGWINWAFSGKYDRKGNTVIFKRR